MARSTRLRLLHSPTLYVPQFVARRPVQETIMWLNTNEPGRRWIGCLALAVLAACGGGGGDEEAEPVSEVATAAAGDETDGGLPRVLPERQPRERQLTR